MTAEGWPGKAVSVFGSGKTIIPSCRRFSTDGARSMQIAVTDLKRQKPPPEASSFVCRGRVLSIKYRPRRLYLPNNINNRFEQFFLQAACRNSSYPPAEIVVTARTDTPLMIFSLEEFWWQLFVFAWFADEPSNRECLNKRRFSSIYQYAKLNCSMIR